MAVPKRHRFLFDIGLTETNITPSDLDSGQLTQAIKEISVGGAAGKTSGTFTGTTELSWVVEVNDTSGGTSIGQAKFRYSKDAGQTWAVSGLTTSTTAVVLELGISFAWTAAASGADFASGDKWTFKTILPHGIEAMLDYQARNRSFRFKDATGTKTLLVDYGAAGRSVRSVMLLDHNLSSSASVVLKGNATASWLAPPVVKSVPWTKGSMGAFFEGGWYRYWLLEITDSKNADAVIQIGKLWIDAYFQPSLSSHIPWQPETQKHGWRVESARRVVRESVEARTKVFPLSWTRLKTQADVDGFRNLRDTCWNTDAAVKLNRPLIFVPDHLTPSDAYICFLDAFRDPQTQIGPDRWTVEMTLSEVVKL